MPNAKNGDKIPALIVFGRIRGSKVDQAAVFLKKDTEAAKKAASDAGLFSLEVTTEEHRAGRGRFARRRHQCAGPVLPVAGVARNNC